MVAQHGRGIEPLQGPALPQGRLHRGQALEQGQRIFLEKGIALARAPTGHECRMRAATSAGVPAVSRTFRRADWAGKAGQKQAKGRPWRCASAAQRASRSRSPLGSRITTAPGPRITSAARTSRRRVLPERVVPVISTCPVSSLQGSTRGCSAPAPRHAGPDGHHGRPRRPAGRRPWPGRFPASGYPARSSERRGPGRPLGVASSRAGAASAVG